MSIPIIELRAWRQFVTLSEELHFGRAASRLHMTQPPLTQSIASLERRLGVRLFDRTQRRVNLSAAGQALLPQVRELLSRAEALPGQARAAAAGEVGRLRLAFVSTVGFELLPAWVRAYRAGHPQVALELVEATGDVQLQAFERGEIDAGFMLHSPRFSPTGLATTPVVRESLVLALPDTHALASTRRLRFEDVTREPLVIFPRRIVPSLHDALFAMYHAAGHSPQVVQEAIQMQTIVNLVSAGIGLAWVPRSVTRFQRPGVVYRELGRAANGRVPACETSLVWSHDAHNPVLSGFVEFARSQGVSG